MDFLDRLIDLALDEDLGPAGDVTTRALLGSEGIGTAELWAKSPLVLAGTSAFARVFQRVDLEVKTEFLARDGQWIPKKAKVARVSGRLASILTGERTALNLIQHTSGIATMTRQAVRAIGKGKLKLLDTRKTSPGMRALSKEAVRAGGGFNHRFGLFDGVLIKDNHIAAVGGSIGEAVRRARAHAPRLLRIEAEVTRLNQIEEAIAAGAHILLLDNMTDAQIAKAVNMVQGRAELEVSGNGSIQRLPRLAKLGVDYASMGALTHSAPAADLSLEIIAG